MAEFLTGLLGIDIEVVSSKLTSKASSLFKKAFLTRLHFDPSTHVDDLVATDILGE